MQLWTTCQRIFSLTQRISKISKAVFDRRFRRISQADAVLDYLTQKPWRRVAEEDLRGENTRKLSINACEKNRAVMAEAKMTTRETSKSMQMPQQKVNDNEGDLRRGEIL